MSLLKFVFLTFFFSFPSLAQDVRILEIKNDIMKLAREYKGKPDPYGDLQKALEQKVQDLEKILPYSTMRERAIKIAGAWKQVFGPYSPKADGKIQWGTDADNIYQVIFPSGFFYNVAVSKISKFKSVFLLKGEYKISDEAIEARFLRNSLMVNNIPHVGLDMLPERLEQGEIKVIHLPRQLPPVGQTGELIEIYADDEIRILRGKSPGFVKTALLIMERVKNVTR